MDISEDALRRMVGDAIDDDPTELIEVARVRPELLVPHHLRLAEAGVSAAPDLYRGMTEETAAELVRRVDAGADPRLVSMLAASGTATAVEAVRRWASQRPAWTAGFHGPVEHAGHGGGWELDASGARRDLVSGTAYQLIKSREPDISGGTVNDAACGWCGMPLWRLLELDAARATEILGRESGAVVVGCCVRCGCYTDYFTERGRFLAGRPRPDFLGHDGDGWELPDEPPLGVGPRRPTPFAGNAWEAGGSTLGGTPDWIQDPAYPACPRCGRTMFYLGQVTGEDAAGEFAEGCHYAFHDPDCGVSAAVYQQS